MRPRRGEMPDGGFALSAFVVAVVAVVAAVVVPVDSVVVFTARRFAEEQP